MKGGLESQAENWVEKCIIMGYFGNFLILADNNPQTMAMVNRKPADMCKYGLAKDNKFTKVTKL